MRPADVPLDPENALQHAPWMASLARHLAGGDAGSDDLLQDTWLAYVSRPPRDPGATGSWLRKVLTNFAIRSRRSEARRRVREESAARPEADPSDPAGVVERAELLQRISEQVLRLDEPYRSTVLLRYFEDLPPAEIARREKVPVNTVYTRLRRALEDLRKRLDAAHGGNRSLWLLVLAPLAAVPLASSGAAAASASLASSSLGKLLAGGIPLASKKIGVAVAFSTCFFLAVGSFVLWTHSSSKRLTPGGMDSSAAASLRAERRTTNAERAALSEAPAREKAQPAPVLDAGASARSPLLRGRVLDARGSGIAGAEVIALPLRLWEEKTAADLRAVDRAGDRDLTDEIGALLRRFRAAAADLPRARSGAAGEFGFESLVDGEHRLLAWCDGYLPSTKTVVLVADPQTTVSDLELADAQTLRGRVVDPENRPVAEASVRSLPVSWRRLGDFERRQAILSFLGEARFLAEASETRSAPDGGFASSTP
jgi:RNA polymerase sigma-70 factor (ECF subfamily)